MSQNIKLSKLLSWLLRHGLVQEGIPIESDGYVKLDDVLSHSKFVKYKLRDIQQVVSENEKKRFSLIKRDEHYFIRANQGHSLEVGEKLKEDKLLTPLLTPLPLVVHGTTHRNYEKIRESGLKKMNRTHIHFAISDDFISGNKQQSGIRSNCQVLIYLDMEKALSDGIKFFLSENKVVLTPGVGEEGVILPQYFKNVVKIDI